MIHNKKVLAVIPARGGSKSVPGKNIRELGGKPLIAWSIDIAKRVDIIDRIIVSTDDDDIEAVSINYGAEVYRRPPELAQDQSLVIDAIKDLRATLQKEGDDSEILVFLEPTCPFRQADDVVKCIELLADGEEKLDSIATFTEASLNPHRAWKINNNTPETFIQGVTPWLPRQKLPEAYQLTGAVYAFYINRLPENGVSLLFGKSGACITSLKSSLDIDTKQDFLFAEYLIKRTENGT